MLIKETINQHTTVKLSNYSKRVVAKSDIFIIICWSISIIIPCTLVLLSLIRRYAPHTSTGRWWCSVIGGFSPQVPGWLPDLTDTVLHTGGVLLQLYHRPGHPDTCSIHRGGLYPTLQNDARSNPPLAT